MENRTNWILGHFLQKMKNLTTKHLTSGKNSKIQILEIMNFMEFHLKMAYFVSILLKELSDFKSDF